MSGGKLKYVRTRCARQLASGLLGGLIAAPWALSLPPALADERSIIVEAAEAADAVADAEPESDAAVATDQSAIEPIALSSDLEPELAETDAVATGAEPTLAEEYLDVVSPRKRDLPADDAQETAADQAASAESTAAKSKPALKIQASSFNGVTPGVTTRAELLRLWGEPLADAATGRSLVYKPTGFTAVSVALENDRVTSLRVELAAPGTTEQLIEKLSLASVRPAIVTNDEGQAITTAFPECGVTFVHGDAHGPAIVSDGDSSDAATAEQVEVIVLRDVEAEPFIRRAATSDARAYADRIADLETALRFDAKSAEARSLLAQAKLATGAAVEAETAAREAVDLEPRNDEYRLEWARCLKHLARYDQAVAQTRAVLESTTATPVLKAQALEQMGLLAALGSLTVQEQAVPLHNKAITLADTLAEDADPSVRAAAHQVLVSAHLAVAERIAAGDFKDKREFVGQWISRASALAEQMIESGEADVSLRLQVALSALSAGEKLASPIDPQPWIKEAEEAVAELTPHLEDELARAELQWQLGLAYLYATELSHRRGECDAAIKFGDLSASSLAKGKTCRRDMPDTEFVMGRLYFQIGAAYAVHRTDHTTACQWYDRAIDPLSQPMPFTALATPHLHGDALVSMAVSYWEIGDRERAYELTGAGVEMLEQGITEGLVKADALGVAQGNFVAMSKALGKIELETPAATSPTAPSEGVKVAQTKPTPTKRTMSSRAQGPQLRTAVRGTQRR
jgi:tetratricopeptide (TPR) repeat protein